MSGYNSSDSPESFLPTSEVFPEDQKQFLDRLNVIYTDIAKNTNSKEIARYEYTETITGQLFFDPANAQNRRYTYRKCFSFGAVISGGTLTIAHGLTGVTMYTRIYGTSLDSTGVYKPLPSAEWSAATAGFGIHLEVDAANITLINGVAGTAAALTGGIIVLEYLKN